MGEHENVPLEITIDDIDGCWMIETYIRENLSSPSIETFENFVDEHPGDLQIYTEAAGQAIMNEVINVALRKAVEEGLGEDNDISTE